MIKKFIPFYGILFLLTMAVSCQTREAIKNPVSKVKDLGLVPEPKYVKLKKGAFVFNQKTRFVIPPGTGQNIEKYIRSHFGLFKISKTGNFEKNKKNTIIFTRISSDSLTDNALCFLTVSPRNIQIKALSDTGFFYALVTLSQLLPDHPTGKDTLPALEIFDEPSFRWRGGHLDVCRHFFDKETVKKYIDLLAFHKMNVFHWHLTEDQGWRIEIKRYPRLTSVGSHRKETIVGKHFDPYQGDGKPYGGYYTQEDIREIVAYASDRFVTVVPEIEMPGHSLAALASYPRLSCTGGPFEVMTRWGVSRDIYCAGNDSVFVFLQNVLDEVMALFPSKYIHIGGDEAPKDRWKQCRKCRARIKAEGLKDENELQSWFIRRIEAYVNSKGRRIIGWDEILEGGLAPHAAVMSWRGEKGGIAAARQHHDVVMSPGYPCYFDHYQSAHKEKEPLAIGGYNPLRAVYDYHPVPDTLPPPLRCYILGAQGNVWTEYIPDAAQLEYMTWPRMCALAEVLWTGEKRPGYEDFKYRLNHRHLQRLTDRDVHFRPLSDED